MTEKLGNIKFLSSNNFLPSYNQRVSACNGGAIYLGDGSGSLKGPNALPSCSHFSTGMWLTGGRERGAVASCSLNSLLRSLHRFRNIQKVLPLFRERELNFSLHYLVFAVLATVSEKLNCLPINPVAEQAGSNSNQVLFVYFISGKASSAKLELCRTGNDHLTRNPLWGLRHQHSKGDFESFFLPNSLSPTANAGHFTGCQANAQDIRGKISPLL